MRCLPLIPVVVFCAVHAVADDRLWARATPPGSTSSAIYGDVRNVTDSPLHLERVTVEGARHVMVHETVEKDGVFRMQHADVSLAPGEKVTLAPGGLHIMIMGLEAPFVQGCEEAVTLHWSDGSRREVAVDVGTFGQGEAPAEAGSPCP